MPSGRGENEVNRTAIDGIEVELSNQAKVLFPRDGYTKGDLIDYYRRVAPLMLPHMRDRPVTMLRYPDGIDGERFFQKDASSYFPSWLRRATVEKKGGTVDHVVCEKTADLVYLANLACITPHLWLSRTDRLDRPDRLIIDIDPSGDEFDQVIDAALLLHDEMRDLGLEAFVMTTGSRGIHIVAPLDRTAGFDEVRELARAISERVTHGNEERFTLEMNKDQRRGRILLDTFRNSYGQTGVAPYAVRAKDGAPVATPLSWAEVEGRDIGPTRYNIRNIWGRLEERGDPWKDIDRHPGDASKAVASAR